jgi:hypothetical protein
MSRAEFDSKAKIPTVVRLRIKDGKVVQDCDVYIGRAQNQGGWKLPASRWQNNHRVKPGVSVDEACRKYEVDIRRNKSLMDLIPSLFGKRLGCWCVGRARCSTCGVQVGKCGHFQCHGEVLVKLVREHLEVAAVSSLSRPPAPAAQDLTAWEELFAELES